jgi:FkbM family methyltransferase
LAPEWRGSAKLIYVFRDEVEPDLDVLPFFLKSGGSMIDVGANYGLFSLAASKLTGPSGRVLAFEPAERTHALLLKNVELNGLRNVDVLRVALSNSSGSARLYHHDDPTRNSLGQMPGGDFEDVPLGTLDNIVKDRGILSVDFLKIDVEGADELVCRGSSELLAKHKPTVLFEDNAGSASALGLRPHGTRGLLRELGYTFFQFSRGKCIRLDDNELPEGNIVAVHRSRLDTGKSFAT